MDLAILYAGHILGDSFAICIVVTDIFARHNANVIRGGSIGLFSTSCTKIVVDNDDIWLLLLLNWLNRSIVADGRIVGLGIFATFSPLVRDIIRIDQCHRRLLIEPTRIIRIVSATFVALAALTRLATAQRLSLKDTIVQLDATAIGLPSPSQFAPKVAK